MRFYRDFIIGWLALCALAIVPAHTQDDQLRAAVDACKRHIITTVRDNPAAGVEMVGEWSEEFKACYAVRDKWRALGLAKKAQEQREKDQAAIKAVTR